MSILAIDLPTALAAHQAVNERLPALRLRAAADSRWAAEVERLEHARVTLDTAISFAYANPTPGVTP